MKNKCKNSLNNSKCKKSVKTIGFNNNIPPVNNIPLEEIGDISNLRFIYWKDNVVKQGDNYYG